jgi:hypothetical protein
MTPLEYAHYIQHNKGRDRKQAIGILDAVVVGAEAWDTESREPRQKRQKLDACRSSRSCNEAEVIAKITVGEAALRWSNGCVGRMLLLGKCGEWQNMRPRALVRLARSVEDTDVESVSLAIQGWANAGDSEDLFQALNFAARDNRGSSKTYEALHEVAKKRMLAIEQQNKILEGGKFCERLATAVKEAREDTESKLRREFEELKAALENQLLIEKQKLKDEVKDHESKHNALKQRILGALDDDDTPRAFD